MQDRINREKYFTAYSRQWDIKDSKYVSRTNWCNTKTKNCVGQSMSLLYLRCQDQLQNQRLKLQIQSIIIHTKNITGFGSWIYITGRDTQKGIFNHTFSAQRMSLTIQWADCSLIQDHWNLLHKNNCSLLTDKILCHQLSY